MENGVVGWILYKRTEFDDYLVSMLPQFDITTMPMEHIL